MITIEFPNDKKITPSSLPNCEKNWELGSYSMNRDDSFVYCWVLNKERNLEVFLFEDLKWKKVEEEEIENLCQTKTKYDYATKITIE